MTHIIIAVDGKILVETGSPVSSGWVPIDQLNDPTKAAYNYSESEQWNVMSRTEIKRGYNASYDPKAYPDADTRMVAYAAAGRPTHVTSDPNGAQYDPRGDLVTRTFEQVATGG